MECAELAPAFDRPTPHDSASKLDAIHTLRVAGHPQKGLRYSARRWIARGVKGRRAYAGKMPENDPQILNELHHHLEPDVTRPAAREGS
jgi:hypothetical protein